jgi:cell division protein FtsL
MNMYGAEAIEFEEQLESRPMRQPESHPAFEVVTGGGLDSRVRAGVSSEFLARVKAVVAGAVIIFVLGTLRVALTSLTVAQLSSNAQVREEIMSFETTNDNLRVERSLMASATRIDRIATQNYGMIAPASFDVIIIEPEAEAEEAEAATDEAATDEAVEGETSAEDEAFDAEQQAIGL